MSMMHMASNITQPVTKQLAAMHNLKLKLICDDPKIFYLIRRTFVHNISNH